MPTPRSSAEPAAGPVPDRSGQQAWSSRPRAVRDRDDDAIDLLDAAGVPVLKRLAPVIGGVLLLLLVWRIRRRRR